MDRESLRLSIVTVGCRLLPLSIGSTPGRPVEGMQAIHSHMTRNPITFLQRLIGGNTGHDALVGAIDAQMDVVLIADGLDQFNESVEPEIMR